MHSILLSFSFFIDSVCVCVFIQFFGYTHQITLISIYVQNAQMKFLGRKNSNICNVLTQLTIQTQFSIASYNWNILWCWQFSFWSPN